MLLETKAMLEMVRKENAAMQAERAAREVERAEREAEQAAREVERAEREAEQAAREVKRAEREAEQAAREEKWTDMLKENAAIKRIVSSFRASQVALRRGFLEEIRTLGGTLSAKDKDIMVFRNEVAHGGDICGDVEAIRYVEDHGLAYAPQYKEAFCRVYGVQFHEIWTTVQSYPQEAIRTFDILASVRCLYSWRQDQSREEIERLALDIIRTVMSTDVMKLPACFGQKGPLQKKFERVDWLFMAQKRASGY
ncbi:uncharacterized protein GIQ15_01743 [Arthroderma uncinatum]|uniref:uncharacterized protein n=1 Tax=Arthroderma uncinatum TaxID=74035 RepID=UPI00144AC755|nr:uncharacterized protein GIQ15_01743 [Arthroderma uncinatum]KAF3492226.1 hypothetical protein GIQ15_01743 [Arthroderma uncinatum]